MKHGPVFNKDCRTCRIISGAIYYPLMGLSISAGTVFGVEAIRMRLYRALIVWPLLPIIVYIANKITNKIAPMTHGMLLDTCEDTRWYKPRKRLTIKRPHGQLRGEDV